MRRATLGLLLAALVPGAAGAEPIRWGYSMTGGESTYSYGPEAEDVLRFYLNPVPERELVTPTEREVYGTTYSHGPYGGYFKPYGGGNWGVGGSYRFRHEARSEPLPVTMTVRDFASNETADIPLTYTVYYHDSIGERLFLPAPESGVLARVTLGGREYEFRNDDNASYGGDGMYVTITDAAPAATPEPATLALAGLGLAGLFARRAVGRRAG